MKIIISLATTAVLCLGAFTASAQELIDRGFVSGWNVMVDPAMGNGCLIPDGFRGLFGGSPGF